MTHHPLLVIVPRNVHNGTQESVEKYVARVVQPYSTQSSTGQPVICDSHTIGGQYSGFLFLTHSVVVGHLYPISVNCLPVTYLLEKFRREAFTWLFARVIDTQGQLHCTEPRHTNYEWFNIYRQILERDSDHYGVIVDCYLHEKTME